jgi:hypothetical protein
MKRDGVHSTGMCTARGSLLVVAGHPPPNSGYLHTIIFSLIRNTTTTYLNCINDASKQAPKSPLKDSGAQNNENETPANERVANHKGEWDTPTRSRVKTVFEVGWTRNAIEKATKVPARSQRKIQSGSDRRPGKKRTGAPKKLSQRDLRTIIRCLTKSFEARQSTWQQLAYDYGHGGHPDTVKYALNREGYYKCKACQMTFLTNDNVANRLAFAKAHKERTLRFWQSVRFTDETHFSMESRATAWVIKDDTERYHPTCVQYKKRNKGTNYMLGLWLDEDIRVPLYSLTPMIPLNQRSGYTKQ